MGQYTKEFKLPLIQDYLLGTTGFIRVGQRHGLDSGAVRKWVTAYSAHGKEGVKKKFSQDSACFKLYMLKRMREHSLSYSYFQLVKSGSLLEICSI